ncbi:MAG: hypothetical protein HY554_17885 [Elusimicrobia bacterium]|nr:hypothetical protein [Elusimicrobiota bacterium]
MSNRYTSLPVLAWGASLLFVLGALAGSALEKRGSPPAVLPLAMPVGRPRVQARRPTAAPAPHHALGGGAAIDRPAEAPEEERAAEAPEAAPQGPAAAKAAESAREEPLPPRAPLRPMRFSEAGSRATAAAAGPAPEAGRTPERAGAPSPVLVSRLSPVTQAGDARRPGLGQASLGGSREGGPRREAGREFQASQAAPAPHHPVPGAIALDPSAAYVLDRHGPGHEKGATNFDAWPAGIREQFRGNGSAGGNGGSAVTSSQR